MQASKLLSIVYISHRVKPLECIANLLEILLEHSRLRTRACHVVEIYFDKCYGLYVSARRILGLRGIKEDDNIFARMVVALWYTKNFNDVGWNFFFLDNNDWLVLLSDRSICNVEVSLSYRRKARNCRVTLSKIISETMWNQFILQLDSATRFRLLLRHQPVFSSVTCRVVQRIKKSCKLTHTHTPTLWSHLCSYVHHPSEETLNIPPS